MPSVDELILASLQRSISVPDAVRLDAWRRASAVNEAHFQAMSRLWLEAEHADPLTASVSAPPSMEVLLARAIPVQQGVATGSPPMAVPTARPRRRLQWSYLTTTALAAAVALFFVGRWSGRPAVEEGGVLSASEFSADTREMVTTQLDDGSVVRLAPQSRLRVTPTAGRREVWLDGEAFFAVARDTARPFSVRTRAGTVEVLGTRFDLRVVGPELRLVVTEGSVALLSGGHRQVVVAGQLATVMDGGIPVVESAVATDSLLAWNKGFLVFERTPLRQVAPELEKHYGVRVLLPDSTVASRTVTAWFANQEFDQVLAAICRAVDAHCTHSDSVASIEP